MSVPNHTLKLVRIKEWSPTKEALDYETNSPHQHLRECVGNSMENMHTDARVERVNN